MAIQWFPGHMHLTKKAIAERIREIDVVIELLDARLPGSSANPMLAGLTGGKPTLKVLNKQDLADPARTALWLAHYNSLPGTRAIGLAACRALVVESENWPRRGQFLPDLHDFLGSEPKFSQPKADPSGATHGVAEKLVSDPNKSKAGEKWTAAVNLQPTIPKSNRLPDASMSTPAKALIEACRALAPSRGSMVKPMRVLICGIPNVGKSTLINTLTGKRATKTGDEAGVTKIEQRIVLADGFYLWDTPGMLWPRIIVAKSGYNLAASGAIGRNAFEEEEVALELLDYLIKHYPGLLQARYKVELPPGITDEQLLEAIGRKRGAVLAKGRVNLQKAAEIVIYEFRSATLGRVTLETPAEFARWLAAGQKLDAERQVKKDRIGAARRGKSGNIPETESPETT
jgi:ribosome biogenesis GTPase A